MSCMTLELSVLGRGEPYVNKGQNIPHLGSYTWLDDQFIGDVGSCLLYLSSLSAWVKIRLPQVVDIGQHPLEQIRFFGCQIARKHAFP